LRAKENGFSLGEERGDKDELKGGKGRSHLEITGGGKKPSPPGGEEEIEGDLSNTPRWGLFLDMQKAAYETYGGGKFTRYT